MKKIIIFALLLILGFLLISCKNAEKDIGIMQDDAVSRVIIYKGDSDVTIYRENDSETITRLKEIFVDLRYTKIEKDSVYGIIYINFYLDTKDNPIYYFDKDGVLFLHYIKKAMTYQCTTKVDYQAIFDCYYQRV